MSAERPKPYDLGSVLQPMRRNCKLLEPRVVADSAPAAADFIADFVAGTDKVDLSLIDANATLSGDQTFLFVDGENTNVVANSVTWYEDSGNTIAQADLNGNTAAAEVQIVLHGVGLNLHATGFILQHFECGPLLVTKLSRPASFEASKGNFY
jgi:hypothetical protein